MLSLEHCTVKEEWEVPLQRPAGTSKCWGHWGLSWRIRRGAHCLKVKVDLGPNEGGKGRVLSPGRSGGSLVVQRSCDSPLHVAASGLGLGGLFGVKASDLR